MATKKEIDDYCKKSGYTRKQLAQAYKDAKEVNTVIQLFAEVGITWDKMAIHQIEELVGLKERTIENLRKKEEEEAKRAAEKKKKKDFQYKKGYKKAIDDFADKIKKECWDRGTASIVNRIAEQLKQIT